MDIQEIFLEFIQETCNKNTFEKYKKKFDEIVNKKEKEKKMIEIRNMLDVLIDDKVLKIKLSNLK